MRQKICKERLYRIFLSRLLKLHVLSKEQHDELHQEFLKKYREFNRRVIKAVMTNVAALMTDDAKVVITSDVDKFYENKVMDTEYVWKLEDSEGNALVEGIREFGEELGYEVVPPAGSLKDSENSNNDLKRIFKVGGDRVLCCSCLSKDHNV